MKRSGWYAGLGVAAAGLLAVSLAEAEALRQGKITKTAGEVSVRLGGEDWQPAEMGMVLQEKDELRTGADSSAEVLLDDGEVAKLELTPNSLFRLNTLSQDAATGDKVTLLDLALGKMRVHAEKLRGDSKFEVRTPTSTTGVRGTVFEVAVDELE